MSTRVMWLLLTRVEGDSGVELVSEVVRRGIERVKTVACLPFVAANETETCRFLLWLVDKANG